MLGVLAFGIKAEWWIRALAGLTTTVGLVVVVKVATAAGRGPLARVAHWIIGSSGDR